MSTLSAARSGGSVADTVGGQVPVRRRTEPGLRVSTVDVTIGDVRWPQVST